MQLRHLLFTSLVLNAPALSSPFTQDDGGSSRAVLVKAQEAQAEVDLLLKQVQEAQEGVAAKRILLAPPVLVEAEADDRGYLGVQMRIEDGVMVIEAVMPGSGAAEAGLQAGDRILRVNKIDLKKDGASDKLAKLKAGSSAKVMYLRDGDKGQVKVELCPLGKLNGEEKVKSQKTVKLQKNVASEVTVDVKPETVTRRFVVEGDPQVQTRVERRVRADAPRVLELSGKATGQGIRVLRSGDGEGQVFELELDGEGADQLPEGARRFIAKRRAAGGGEGQVMVFGIGEGPESEVADHDEDSSEVHVRRINASDGRRMHLATPDGKRMEVHVDVDVEKSDAPKPHGRAVVRVQTDDGDEEVMEIELDGEHLKGLPGRVRELIKEHGGDGEHRSMRFKFDDKNMEGMREHIRELVEERVGDGMRRGMQFKFDGGDLEGMREHLRELVGERGGDGEHRVMEFKFDGDHLKALENLPEHIHELIEEHAGDGRRMVMKFESDGEHMEGLDKLPERIREAISKRGGRGEGLSQGFFIRSDDEDHDHGDGHDHDAHADHDKSHNVMRFGGGSGLGAGGFWNSKGTDKPQKIEFDVKVDGKGKGAPHMFDVDTKAFMPQIRIRREESKGAKSHSEGSHSGGTWHSIISRGDRGHNSGKPSQSKSHGSMGSGHKGCPQCSAGSFRSHIQSRGHGSSHGSRSLHSSHGESHGSARGGSHGSRGSHSMHGSHGESHGSAHGGSHGSHGSRSMHGSHGGSHGSARGGSHGSCGSRSMHGSHGGSHGSARGGSHGSYGSRSMHGSNGGSHGGAQGGSHGSHGSQGSHSTHGSHGGAQGGSQGGHDGESRRHGSGGVSFMWTPEGHGEEARLHELPADVDFWSVSSAPDGGAPPETAGASLMQGITQGGHAFFVPDADAGMDELLKHIEELEARLSEMEALIERFSSRLGR